MGSYVGKYAEYYNHIYANKPYKNEAAFVHTCLQRHTVGTTSSLLELACGTGRHALELEKLGYQILATDYSADLLAVAHSEAERHDSTVAFELQDMRELQLGGRTFDAAYCLFDSIGYVQTNQAVLQVLQNVHAALRPSGLLLLEFWHAAAMLRAYEPERQATWMLPNGELARKSRTTLHVERQLAEVSYSLRETAADGSLLSEIQETQWNRYFLVQEMALFLQSAGFEAVEWMPAYQIVGPIDMDTWHVMVVARRA
ncbi:MAG TPA: class I SAM-dependent methyltransferase [Anaerolineales bacterium]|nr:class I SAM-dependent methyltransferase [Anaerolineales bacterium]HRQ92525.1 class I SAM-dependent methyltransferase [Anaerolineales bacterium]